MSKKKWLIMALSLVLACGTAATLGACTDDTESSISESSSSLSSEGGQNESSSDTFVVEEEEELVASLKADCNTVVIGVGDSYLVKAKATGTSIGEFTWNVDGNSDAATVMLTQSSDTGVAITGLKAGTATVVVSAEIDGELYWERIEVTVKEVNHITVDIPNLSMNKGGYSVSLSTIANPDSEEDLVKVIPQATVYNRGEALTGLEIDWTSENEEIVRIENGAFVSVAEGETTVVGSYKVGGAVRKVIVSVSVYRPEIKLSGKTTIEVENMSDVLIPETLEGNVKGVTLNGKSVGTYSSVTKSVTLDKASMPKSAELMGDDKQLIIETDKAHYLHDVSVYTKIINTKEELDAMGELAKACEESGLLWNGYFVLGSDIAYNGKFASIADSSSIYNCPERQQDWTNGLVHGFAGTFDGKGHTIDGMEIDRGTEVGGFFGVLHAKGVIKNVAFTNASVSSNSGLVCSAGAGSVENVYVQFKAMGAGPLHPNQVRYSGSFFTLSVDVGASVTDCFVDVSQTKFANEDWIRLVGSKSAEHQRVYVVGGESLHKNAGVTTTYKDFNEFTADKSAQMSIQNMDSSFWSVNGGVPLSKSLYEAFSTESVLFDERTVGELMAGSEYAFDTNSSYVRYTINETNGVTISNGLISVGAGVATGTQITVRATSYFNGENYAEKTLTVFAAPETLDLTSEEAVAYLDITDETADFADYTTSVSEQDILYYMTVDGKATSITKLELGKGTMLAVTKNKVFRFNYQAVTNVIYTLEELECVRYYTQNVEGYYVLGSDIDGAGKELKEAATHWDESRGFRGTFDGRGHTIKNVKINGYGLFGNMGKATVKNVNFEEVKVGACLLAYNILYSTVENVKVTFAENGTTGLSGLLYSSYAPESTFKNITIDASKLTGAIKTAFGVAWGQGLDRGAAPTFENVVITAADITNFALVDWSLEKGTVAWPETDGLVWNQN
ncbi:MAG: hypothetical protein IJ393_00990 [Clostridia bacterium]|nr:hypothetical protein [Clostridia bacterium]